MVAVSVHFDLAFTFDAHSVVSSSCGITIPHTVVYHKRNPSNLKFFRYSVRDQALVVKFSHRVMIPVHVTATESAGYSLFEYQTAS